MKRYSKGTVRLKKWILGSKKHPISPYFIRILELNNKMFSTHLLTVLIICVITQVEQRKGKDLRRPRGTKDGITLPMLGNNKVQRVRKGGMTYVVPEYF